MLKIEYAGDIYTVEITSATTLAELVGRAGIMLDLRCAGLGVCGRCQVQLNVGDFIVSGKPVNVAEGKVPIIAPACHTEISGSQALISVPSESVVHADGQIAVDYSLFAHPERRACELIAIRRPNDFNSGASSLNAIDGYHRDFWTVPALRELGDVFEHSDDAWLARLEGCTRGWIAAARPQRFTPLAIAIDLGTTTIAAALLDMDSGEPLASVSAYNRQATCGDNVSSRISYSASTPGGLERLRRLAVDETINPLISRLLHETGHRKNDVVKVSIAGNTVMSHLFLGISPRSIGMLPFLPVTKTFPQLPAADCGLAVNPAAVVELLPAVAGYIGGDITAGIISSGQHHRSSRSLLVDIGTNCEIVLCDGSQLYACAAAAGPAFEGAGIACGSRAAAGAIDRIDFTADFAIEFTTIDHAPPAGLCGSAILDFIAGGFNCGLIDAFGRYDLARLREAGLYLEVNYGNGPIHACRIASRPGGKPIYVSEADLEQVLKAKAAVYAGIKALLCQCHLRCSDLENVYLAGGFAKYMRISSAITTGMLPPVAEAICKKVGNSSLAGAVMNAIDPDFPALADRVIAMPHTVELNIMPEFEDLYIDALMIPNFDPAKFAELS